MQFGFSLFFLLALSTHAASSNAFPIRPQAEKIVATPSSIQNIENCPRGFSLHEGRCISNPVEATSSVCSPGTTLLNGQCTTSSRATESFSKDGAGEKVQRCRLGTKLSHLCPSETHKQEGPCLPSTHKGGCSGGHKLLRKKHPVKRLIHNKSSICPTGYTLTKGRECVKSITASPKCDPGYSLVGKECVKQLFATCPPGYSFAGKECRRKVESLPRLVCPTDFTLDSQNVCIREVSVPSTCPRDTVSVGSGYCERAVPKQAVCDTGETLVHDQCQRTSVSSPEFRCSDEYSLVHNKCKKVTSQDPVARCAVGFLKENQCITERRSSPLLRCPDDYQLAKGPKCIREVTYDCSENVVKTECDMPSFVGSLAGRHLQSDRKANYKNKSTPSESKTPRCAQVVHTVPKKCTKVESTPVEYSCPDGSIPIGKNCPIVQSSPPDPYCKVGQLDKSSNLCVSIEVEPLRKICAMGQLKSDGYCYHIEKKAATFVCPKGSEQGDGKDVTCVITVPETVHPNRVVRQPPLKVCDVGVLQGKVCVLIEKASPVF